MDMYYMADANRNAATGQDTNKRPSYADQRKAITDRTKLAKEALALGYNNNISQLGQNYTTQRNDAAVNSALQKKALQENMANMGLSGAGGTSQTMQLQRANNLNSNLASIGTAEQNAINDLNTQRQQSELQITSDEIAAIAKLRAAEQAELFAQDQFNRQQDQLDRQLEFNENQAKIDNAMKLLSANKITAEQFKTMTGITVQEAARQSNPQPTEKDLFNDLVKFGANPIEAANASGYKPVVSHNAYYDPKTGKMHGAQGSISPANY